MAERAITQNELLHIYAAMAFMKYAQQVEWDRRAFFEVAALCLLLSLWVGETAEAQPDDEYRQKAAVIMNVALYTYWPMDIFPGNKAPINICLYKGDPFGTYFDELVWKRKYRSESGVERNLAVWRVATEDDLTDCHIVFVPGKNFSKDEIRSVSVKHRLVIGETDEFVKQGGQMSVYMHGKKVGFSVNLDSIASVELSISSQLLRLAEIVRDNK